MSACQNENIVNIVHLVPKTIRPNTCFPLLLSLVGENRILLDVVHQSLSTSDSEFQNQSPPKSMF